MPLFTSKRVISIIIGLVVFAVLVIVFMFLGKKEPEVVIPEEVIEEAPPEPQVKEAIIGTSVMGRNIVSYTFGDGDTELLFVGGIHGGYEWNSVLLSYELIDYLTDTKDTIADDLKVTVIPSANPDGLYEVIGVEGRFTAADVPPETGPVGTGRFNANDVDLNRNFDCKWQPDSTWRGNTVSAGVDAFSEPEAKAIRDYVLKNNPVSVIFFHSQANAVYASECTEGILPDTLTILNAYAQAAGYPAVASFDAYEVTGDAEGWLASIGIPALTVELSTHESIEWEKNKKGIEALFSHYSHAK